MKPNQDQIEDQLLDALLHGQNRGDREQELADIETALNHGMDSSRVNVRSKWPKRLGVIAASVAVGGLTVFWMDSSRKEEPALAMLDTQESRAQEIDNLKAAISAQEEKVEESRKVLTTISRTKDIAYYGEGEVKNDVIERGLDAHDYADAKRDYEADRELLQSMKQGQLGNQGAEVNQLLAANQTAQPTDGTNRKPSPPVGSMAKVIASATPAPTQVPIPEIALNTLNKSSVDFDRDKYFGKELGDVGGAGGGGFARSYANEASARSRADLEYRTLRAAYRSVMAAPNGESLVHIFHRRRYRVVCKYPALHPRRSHDTNRCGAD